MIQTTFWSWFAGFWEGEGCFTVQVTPKRRMCELNVTQTKLKPLTLIRDYLGGNIHTKRHSNPDWSQTWTWRLTRKDRILDVCQRMFPYLCFRNGEVAEKMATTRFFIEEEHLTHLAQTLGVSKIARRLNRGKDAIYKRRKHLGLGP